MAQLIRCWCCRRRRIKRAKRNQYQGGHFMCRPCRELTARIEWDCWD